MNADMHPVHSSQAVNQHLIDEVERAVWMLTTDCQEVSAVHVVPGRRPTFTELSLIQHCAVANGLRISLLADGSLSIRALAPITSAERPPAAHVPLDRVAAMTRRFSHGAGHVLAAIGDWNAGFPELHQGLR